MLAVPLTNFKTHIRSDYAVSGQPLPQPIKALICLDRIPCPLPHLLASKIKQTSFPSASPLHWVLWGEQLTSTLGYSSVIVSNSWKGSTFTFHFHDYMKWATPLQCSFCLENPRTGKSGVSIYGVAQSQTTVVT